MYWTGNRDQMLQRMDRARAAGAVGLIATLDWSFSMGRDWGSPEIPEKVDLKTMVRIAPQVVLRARVAARSSPAAARSPTCGLPTWPRPGAARPPPSSAPTTSG